MIPQKRKVEGDGIEVVYTMNVSPAASTAGEGDLLDDLWGCEIAMPLPAPDDEGADKGGKGKRKSKEGGKPEGKPKSRKKVRSEVAAEQDVEQIGTRA